MEGSNFSELHYPEVKPKMALILSWASFSVPSNAQSTLLSWQISD